MKKIAYMKKRVTYVVAKNFTLFKEYLKKICSRNDDDNFNSPYYIL
jgi:hypothetical protein